MASANGDDAGGSSDTRPFRQRLDEVLRTRDPAAVRDFLVAEDQWPEDSPADEFAMWMMIAGSPALPALHAEAEQWLMAHGHVAEAHMIAGNRARPGRTKGPSQSRRSGGDGRGSGKRPRKR